MQRNYLLISLSIMLFASNYNNGNQDAFSQGNSPEALNVSDEIDRLLAEREEEFKKKNTKICLAKQDVELDNTFLYGLIVQCPIRLCYIIETIITRNQFEDDLYQGVIPPHLVLVGPPGVGKTTLARAIAQAAQIPYTFIKAMALANEYVNSGPSNLLRIFEPILEKNEPHIVIIDELQTIIRKKDNNEFDMATAEALWMLLDECKAKNNILVIATANDISDLPEQLKSRFAKSVYAIKLPSLQARERIITYYLAKNSLNHSRLTMKDIQTLAQQTKGFSARDLEAIIMLACSNAYFRSKQNNNKDIILSKKDLEVGFAHIKNQKNTSYSIARWYKNFVTLVGPAAVISLGITVAQIALQCFLQYCDQKRHLVLLQMHHEDLMSMNRMHNQEILQQNELLYHSKV